MLRISFIIFLLSIFLKESHSQPRKWALLVGVSKYAPGSKLKPLSSHNDLILLEKALKNIGFKEDEIILKEDSNATCDKIKYLLEEEVLPRLKIGDFVYFHFSGHGQQMYDDNGDEFDGLDEAIMPYDAALTFKKGQPEKHLRDDYLGAVFAKMQVALGGTGQLMVSLDACHSGTGTRGALVETDLPTSRGTHLIYGESPTNNQPNINKGADMTAPNFGIASNSDGKATMVCFFGSSPQELNYEYWSKDLRAGSLSYSLYKALNRIDKGTSFRDLYQRIKSIMGSIAPMQSPQAEGPLDKLIFSNGITKPAVSFLAVGPLTGNQIQINAGSIDGVMDTSQFLVMLQQPDRSMVEITKARVSNRGLASSVVSMEKYLPEDSINLLRFILPKKAVKAELAINTAQAPAWKNSVLLASTDDYNFLPGISQAPFVLKEHADKSGKSLLLYNQQMKIGNWKLDESNVDKVASDLQKKLRKLAWTQFLKQVNSQMPECKVSVELWVLPFDTVAKKPRLDQPLKKITDFNVLPTLCPEHCYKIHIKNETGNKLYYSIIDFQPDEVANFMVPYGNEQPSSFVLQPYESVEFPGFDYYLELAPPMGKEMLKVIASSLPIDFSGLSTRGSQDFAMAQVLDAEDAEGFPEMLHSGTRGVAPARLASFVYTLNYIIKF